MVAVHDHLLLPKNRRAAKAMTAGERAGADLPTEYSRKIVGGHHHLFAVQKRDVNEPAVGRRCARRPTVRRCFFSSGEVRTNWRHNSVPVPPSRQTRCRPPFSVSAAIRNNRSSQTIGEACPSSLSGVFQRMFSDSLHFVGIPFSRLEPSPRTPRHIGQFSAATLPAINAQTNALPRTLFITGFNSPRRLRIENAKVFIE